MKDDKKKNKEQKNVCYLEFYDCVVCCVSCQEQIWGFESFFFSMRSDFFICHVKVKSFSFHGVVLLK